MRVAYICADPEVPASVPTASSTPLPEMCAAMADLGFEVSLFAQPGGAPYARHSAVRVIDIKSPTAVDPVAREHETVVANGETAMALAKAGPFDIIYQRASLWSAAPMNYARRTATIGVLELQSSVVEQLAPGLTLPHARAARALLLSSMHAAHLVIAATDDVANAAQVIMGGHARVHVPPRGCELQRLTQVSRDVGRGDFVVGYVGALELGHGLDTLVDAFATLVATRVPHAHLLVVGDGSERQELLRRAGRRGLSDRLTCVDGVNADLPNLLAKMNVVVAPHIDERVPPLTMTECMAAGLPIVASAIPALRSFVRHNQMGVLFATGDAASLASVLGQLHADPLRIRHLAHESRAYATRHFTAGRWLELILNLAYAAPREPTARLAAS